MAFFCAAPPPPCRLSSDKTSNTIVESSMQVQLRLNGVCSVLLKTCSMRMHKQANGKLRRFYAARQKHSLELWARTRRNGFN